MSQADLHNQSHDGRRPWLRRTAVVVAATSVIAASGGAMLANAKVAETAPINPPAVQAPIQGLADMVEQVRPAVVSVLVEGTVAEHRDSARFRFHGDPRMREFFEHFFGRMPGMDDDQARERHMRAAGSGFIVSASGYIVTNNHVVSEADDIKVVLDDGTELTAELQGTDPKTDLALLKVDADQALPYVQFGDSEDARAGDWVVSIGNPFGLGGTVTTGIISARGRDINSGPYDDFLQIDAPINKGNSGGPLFNLDGEVIGVNTAILSPSGGNIGIGFAIPSGQARTVIASLKEQGYVERGKLGVQIQTVTEDLAKGLALDEPRGALVSDVVPGSPAAEAGIEVGDVIVGLNGKPVKEMRELPRRVARLEPGSEARLELLRNGERRQLGVTLGAQQRTTAKAGEADGDHQESRLGVMAAPVNERSRARFDLPEGVDGAVLVRVQPGSAAARAGLRPGDVIRQVNGKPVTSAGDLSEAVHSNPENLVMLVNREGNQWFVNVDASMG